MKENYSLTPETRNPMKALFLVTVSSIHFIAGLVYCNDVNKSKNEKGIYIVWNNV